MPCAFLKSSNVMFIMSLGTSSSCFCFSSDSFYLSSINSSKFNDISKSASKPKTDYTLTGVAVAYPCSGFFIIYGGYTSELFILILLMGMRCMGFSPVFGDTPRIF